MAKPPLWLLVLQNEAPSEIRHQEAMDGLFKPLKVPNPWECLEAEIVRL